MTKFNSPVSTKEFIVTYVPISPTTRRRTGKSQTEHVTFDRLAKYCPVEHRGTEKHPDPPEPTPQNVELAFEKMARGQVKVIDVRDACDHSWEGTTRGTAGGCMQFVWRGASMSFQSPMLARPMPENFGEITPQEWSAEEKYDGHRIVVEIGDRVHNLLGDKVEAWSRYGKSRVLPEPLSNELNGLPRGLYDGEIYVPGKRSYGTAELANADQQIYAVFDILEFQGKDTTSINQCDRRRMLETIFQGRKLKRVQLAKSWRLKDLDHAMELFKSVRARDGEGLILKYASGVYQIGKRSKFWIKLKDLKSAALTVTGFSEGRGQIVNTGPCGITNLVDDQGNPCSVRTLNDQWRDALAMEQFSADMQGKPHPRIGTKLRIEFQERTPDGKYRHPRWDRWEDE